MTDLTTDPYEAVTTQDPDAPQIGPVRRLVHLVARTVVVPLATRTGEAAHSWAAARTGWASGYCQQFVRSCFGVPARYGTAASAWANAKFKHPASSTSTSIPANVPVFWTGGSHGYGHVAYSVGGGYCRSTDWPHAGQVSVARISSIGPAWGLHFQGWAEDINGYRVYSPPKTDPTLLDLSNVVAAMKSEGAITNGLALKKAIAAEVGDGGMDMSTRYLGNRVRAQYRLVQRKYLATKGITHPTASSVDGIPGSGSLHWLASRHGLKVKA